jgi:sugar lactone lactonase YvrE
MRHSTGNSGSARRRAAIGLVALASLLVPAPVVAAGQPQSEDGHSVIVLPGAKGAEGIAAGEDDTFFAGDLATGDIFRGDIHKGTAKKFIDVPDGRVAVGMKADTRNDLLFVAGGPSGKAYVYDTDTKKTVKTYQLTKKAAFINDVALTDDGAWFTNSNAAELYFVPVGDNGNLGDVRTLKLTGPAAKVTKGFNLNGIAYSPDARRLLVAHSENQAIYTVSPRTGASAEIKGVKLPNVDGILVKGSTVWAMQNFSNQVSRLRVNFHESTARLREVIKSQHFNIPTTAALFGDDLAVVNAKFGVPNAKTFEVVVVDARGRSLD